MFWKDVFVAAMATTNSDDLQSDPIIAANDWFSKTADSIGHCQTIPFPLGDRLLVRIDEPPSHLYGFVEKKRVVPHKDGHMSIVEAVLSKLVKTGVAKV